MSVTIYHNPNCGTSRNTLAILREHGIDPVVIEYLQTPPERSQLVEMIEASGLTVREIMRSKQDIYSKLNLDDPSKTDDELIDAMMEHPILINRPIVVTEKGTRLCRPKETVLEIL